MMVFFVAFVIPQSLDYFAIDKHSTAAGRNHTMYSSIKTEIFIIAGYVYL